MKKILFIIACSLQLINAQTTPLTGEYISIERSSPGINLILNNDKTFQLYVFGGTYEVVNDSIIFGESIESKQKNYFNVQFSKNKSTSKKLKFSIKPSLMMGLTDDFLGTQSKENGEITYISIYDYLKEKNDDDDFRNAYLEDENFQFTFELEKPYAIYLASDKGRENITKIEKYIIPSDVTEIAIENNFSLFDNLKLAGNVSNDQSINVFVERKPIKFLNKQKRIESNIFEKPATKTIEKNWTFPGKKDRYSIYDDSTAVVVDSSAAVEFDEYNSESDYKFVAKVETSFEEAVKNLKNKYLVIYYNPKSKDPKKEFDRIIEEYNQEVGYKMYDGYDEESDKFNFYLASSKDEKFFTANGITKFPATIIVNEKKQLLASSKNKYRSIANDINRYNFTEKIETAKNAIQIDEVLNAKKIDNAKLAKLLANKEDNFYSTFLDVPHNVSDLVYDEEVTDTTETIVEIDESYYEKSFTYYKLKTTQAVFNQKIKDLFVSFQAKKIVDEELIGILLNEIVNNQNSQKFFDKENSFSKEDIKKYLAYAITYNGDKSKKVKILNTVAGYILDLEDKNDVVYEEMTKSMMLSSNYDAFQTKTYLEVVSHKSSKIEEVVNAVNQFYNNINTNQALFENLNTQFENMNEVYKRNSDWNDFKNLNSSVFIVASKSILQHNQTTKFSDVQKWLECANKISRDNLDVTKVTYEYYTVIGNKTKADEFKAKLDILAKEE